MSAAGCSLFCSLADDEREFGMADYEAARPRWCAGCGDLAVLTSMQRLLAEEQLAPERTVFVSGIGCSSRFPHYMKTYGFHGLHGRALPVATGIKLHRPELEVFVVMGDGDCISIGAGHWVHATRYNMDMVALMLDNEVYGLTKNQSSPTTPAGYATNTQPYGTYLPAMNPVEATLGITNASFVAQTAEWIPPHLYATLKAAYQHDGFAFVRILQRCPKFTGDLFQQYIQSPDMVELLEHEAGVETPALHAIYKNRRRHDPGDIDAARRLAEMDDVVRLGIFFRDESFPRYEETRSLPSFTAEERISILNEEFDRYAV
ncbi:MAG: thiamine pyrophosphate-dependent enzyme [Gemmatimonadota bacterium]